MTSASLKWLALITMVIDHIGAIFFPNFMLFDMYILRVIGRISFPIFAFLLVQGFKKTRNRTNYLIRLLVFAIISEVPYDLAFHGAYVYWKSQSIMLELAIGFVALIFLEKSRKNPVFFLASFAMVFVAILCYADYAAYGICLIIVLYLFSQYRGADVLALIGVTYLFYAVTNFGFAINGYHFQLLTLNSVQLYACFSAIPLVFYNGKRGFGANKWLFYIFYPFHLALFWGIKIFLNTL